MHAVENRSLVGQGSLLQGYLHHTTLLSFGVGESSEMEAKRCGLAVNRPLFISKGKAPLGKSKKELGDERANNRVLPIIKCIPQNNNQEVGRKPRNTPSPTVTDFLHSLTVRSLQEDWP